MIISVSQLSKHYRVYQKQAGIWGSVTSLFHRNTSLAKAVDDISFTINEGELIGFIGPNGAGKTTTLKCLSGLLYPTSGEISVLGYTPFERKKSFLKQISLVMGQKNQLWWDLPAWESFILNKEIYEVPQQQFDETVKELASMLDIEDVLKVQVRKLSLGQRMKAELIAALLHNPKVLFLDEPTIGLDVVAQKKMRDFIKEYNLKYKATIILTSHYMGDVKELCKRVIVIDKGVILYDGLLENIVEKFAPHKVITVDFEKLVDREKLLSIGEVQEFSGNHASIHVPRDEAPKRAGKLLQKFKVTDLTIEEPPIEDIIRQVFGSKS